MGGWKKTLELSDTAETSQTYDQMVTSLNPNFIQILCDELAVFIIDMLHNLRHVQETELDDTVRN